MSNLVLNAGLFSWIGDWFYGLWINLMLLIDNVIYVFINWLYRIFMLVAKVDIFGGGAEIEAITRRIYIIVGIAMLFIFAYNLILLIINPEGKQIGNMAKVVQNAIISIILVTLLPLIFSYLTKIQNHILDTNVIGQVILGTSGADEESTNKKAGVKVALDIFSAFYHPEGQTYNSCKSNTSAHELCDTYVKSYDYAYANESISSFVWDADLKDGAKKGKMEYNWIISAAAGIWALWCFVSFALDIGVRVGKMAFYEIISPVPVMMRILPNDKMFDKWFKGITNTYLSLFVRLVVIYFCMYAITLVPTVLTNMWASNGDNFVLFALANVVVILGILQFAKEAPKLLSDLFGGSGDGLKFGIASKLRENPINTPIGMIRSGNYARKYGTVTDDDGNEINTGGFFRGAWRGRHGYAQGRAQTDALIENKKAGAGFKDITADRLRVMAGLKTSFEEMEDEKKREMDANRFEERREHNKKALDKIDAINETAKKIVEAVDSSYMSGNKHDVVITDKDGNVVATYSLANMNYNDMKNYVERMNKDGKDISHIREVAIAAEKFHKGAQKIIKEEIYTNGTDGLLDSVTRGQKATINNALDDLRSQLASGVAESVVDGELIAAENTSEVTSVDQAEKIEKAIKGINREMDVAEMKILEKYNSSSAKYRAKQASSKYVQNKSSSGDKKS